MLASVPLKYLIAGKELKEETENIRTLSFWLIPLEFYFAPCKLITYICK